MVTFVVNKSLENDLIPRFASNSSRDLYVTSIEMGD